MKKIDRASFDDGSANAMLDAFLDEEDPEILRTIIFELMLATGIWYRKAQIYKLLHPLFFVAGFATAYFLSG
tara:strand:- start:910 stop:1125 length:216 start_codon:yes stop_codon:yes gene_type:complete